MAYRHLQATLSPALIATISAAEQSFAVGPGDLNLGAVVAVSKPTQQAGLIMSPAARVVSLTNIAIVFGNSTVGSITPTAGEVYQFVVID